MKKAKRLKLVKKLWEDSEWVGTFPGPPAETEIRMIFPGDDDQAFWVCMTRVTRSDGLTPQPARLETDLSDPRWTVPDEPTISIMPC